MATTDATQPKRRRAQSRQQKRQPWSRAGRFQAHRVWLFAGIAYGISWPLVEGINLSWLAWGALVPLFLALRDQQTFGAYAGRVLGFATIATLICCAGWFFGVPSWIMWKTALGGALQIVFLSVPLLLLFPIKKRMSYDRALWIVVFLWPLCEWAIQYVPLSLNILWLSNSQGANTWLIQYIDLFGTWALTAWVVLFNVLLYRAYCSAHEQFTKRFRRQALRSAAVLVVPALLYGAVRYAMLEPSQNPIRISLLYTNNPPTPDRLDLAFSNIERITHLTDAAHDSRQGIDPDLYVWPEGTLNFDWEIANVRSFLYQAIDDWQTPLLTGTNRREVRSTGPDTVVSNQAVLIHPGGDSTRTVHAYNKVKLVAFHEGIPGYRHLQHMPSVRRYFKETYKMTPGDGPTLLSLDVRDGRTLQLGTPICHEVNFPEHWAAMARTGADIFVLPTFESWFGDLGLQAVFAGITRIRTIENRRSTVRSANGGVTVFVDAFGTMQYRRPQGEGSTSAYVNVYDGRSLYSHFPYLFPLSCMVAVVGLLAHGVMQSR